MAKTTIYVTAAQVMAAQLQIEMHKQWGTPIPNESATRAIANAQPAAEKLVPFIERLKQVARAQRDHS